MKDSHKKILIVDDDSIFSAQLTLTLKRLNYHVIGVAQSGKKAIDLLRTTLPDLILMDINMESKFAGIEAAKSIHKTAKIPVIFLTGESDDDMITKAVKTSPYGYIIKPVQPHELKAAIDVGLTRYNYENRIQKYQKELKNSEALFKGIFNNVKSGYFQIDHKLSITLANPYMIDMLNASSQESLIGRNIFQCFSKLTHIDTFQKSFNKSDNISLSEAIWETDDGNHIQVLFEISCVEGSTNYIGFVQDITQYKQIEYQLYHSQKMEALGTLSGYIAHEVNNQMNNILGYADLCRMNTSKDDKTYKYVNSIYDKAYEAAITLRQLLKFSRKEKPTLKKVNIDRLIDRKIELIDKITGSLIIVNTSFNTSDIYVNIDPKLFDQIVMNIIINAKDAITESGKIIISTKSATSSKDSRWYYKLPKNKYVNISIQDDGTGITPDIIDEIFEPFITTKDASLGTGLGLAIVKNILKDMGGYIFVESEVEKRTAFELFIPVIPS